MSNESHDTLTIIENRIEEIKVEITELERDDSNRGLWFYTKGSELYMELDTLNLKLALIKRYMRGTGD